MHWLKNSLVRFSFWRQSPGLLRRQSESLSIGMAFGDILLAQILDTIDGMDGGLAFCLFQDNFGSVSRSFPNNGCSWSGSWWLVDQKPLPPRPLPRPPPPPRPPPMPRPLPPPLAPRPPLSAASLRALFLGLGASSINRVSRGSESGRM
jgi:hypothetical protein